VFNEMKIEVETVNKQCKLELDLANYQYGKAEARRSLQDAIAQAQLLKEGIDRSIQTAGVIAQLTACSAGLAGTPCPTAAVASAVYAGLTYEGGAVAVALDSQIAAQQSQIAEIQATEAYWVTNHNCEVMRAVLDGTVKKLLLRIATLDLEALKSQYRIQLGHSELRKLRNQATRLLAEQRETEAQTINVAAAQ